MASGVAGATAGATAVTAVTAAGAAGVGGPAMVTPEIQEEPKVYRWLKPVFWSCIGVAAGAYIGVGIYNVVSAKVPEPSPLQPNLTCKVETDLGTVDIPLVKLHIPLGENTKSGNGFLMKHSNSASVPTIVSFVGNAGDEGADYANHVEMMKKANCNFLTVYLENQSPLAFSASGDISKILKFVKTKLGDEIDVTKIYAMADKSCAQSLLKSVSSHNDVTGVILIDPHHIPRKAGNGLPSLGYVDLANKFPTWFSHFFRTVMPGPVEHVHKITKPIFVVSQKRRHLVHAQTLFAACGSKDRVLFQLPGERIEQPQARQLVQAAVCQFVEQVNSGKSIGVQAITYRPTSLPLSLPLMNEQSFKIVETAPVPALGYGTSALKVKALTV